MELKEKIYLIIRPELDLLDKKIQDWVQKRLIEPRKIQLIIDQADTSVREFWLVTDNIGTNDSSYRVVYDEQLNQFGLEMTLKDGKEMYLGPYGTFTASIKAM